ncbi:LysM peptidoglycan-binding domain-containing protein [Brumimicrobium mesophilum]|uniref:LysM peptidoglycan-binding domain-containing protein n=1 Tax=Brumimicrobium mesophilum TaxID=392717 RepID=UPI000D1415DE|nr:LysM peptidoglycan-binding domain-containing protein [Brumimicrobium mesophilum]
MKITVKDNQTIYDIALQYAGSLEAVIDILEVNGKIDTTLLIGEELTIPSVLVPKISEFYSSSNLTVATSSTPLQVDGFVPPPSINRQVDILINGTPLIIVQAPTTYDLSLVDSVGSQVQVDLVGGQVVVPSLPCSGTGDATVNIRKENGDLIETILAPVSTPTDYNVLNSVISIDNHSWEVGATDNLNLQVVDSNNDPVTTTKVGNNLVVGDLPCTPIVIQHSSAELMSTGVTASTADYDDGFYEAGRDFFVLDSAPVHLDGSPTVNTTTNRFTDDLGGQNYLNNIVVDWSTWNFVKVLAYSRHDTSTLDTYNNFRVASTNYSISVFTTGWRLPNITELYNICFFGNPDQRLVYPSPYSAVFNISSIVFWSNTEYNSTQMFFLSTNGAFPIQNRLKTDTRKALYVRNMTPVGTTLT